MIENIAIWGGVAGLCVSLFAVIILFLTRNNILNILDKDVILFDKNFEIKKHAISTALNLVDEISQKGKAVTYENSFAERAKQCYNDLLCVLSDVRIADEFYNIALDKTCDIDEIRLAQFKLICRRDIGLKTKKAKLVKRTTEQKTQPAIPANPKTSFEEPAQAPVEPTTIKPATPAMQRLVNEEIKPRVPAQAQNAPARPMGARPMPPKQPMSAQRPATLVRKVTKPKDED